MRLQGCDYPDHLLYDRDGALWAKAEGAVFRIGATPSVAWLAGGVTGVSFKAEGARVVRGASLGSVEGPRHFDVVRAPFDCTLVATNRALLSDPRPVARDPFGAGWLAVLAPVGSPVGLSQISSVAAEVEARLKSLRIRCFAEFPDRDLYEIGVECSAVLVQLNDLLAESAAGTVVHVVSDDQTAEIEMERWQGQTGNLLLESFRDGSVYHFIVKKR
ncbi:MAG TPA: hypothetical protein VLY21_00175 [Nitrososphaerales archaeon]|nr:hypothetical protein [Nitrososphaerales archaeon]